MIASFLAGGLAGPALAAGKPRRPQSFLNFKLPTTGGQQMWADVRLFHQWRIQRHALSGHYRLLDGDNERLAWGTLAACEAELDALSEQLQLPPISGTAVLLLHGLFRTRGSMSRIGRYLAQHTDWPVLNVSYPSTRGAVAEHAETLRQVIDHLPEVETFHFVAHSMGNLVIRHWLADLARDEIHGEESARLLAERLGRIVMLGPPNQRPSLAQSLVPIDRHKIISGDAGNDLNGGWKELEPRLTTPPCEFGILAGGRGDGAGHNPLIPGDDDMIVGVAETHLAGACDFRVLPVIHATMMDDLAVQQMACRFLQKGFFESADTRKPLE